MTKIKIFALIFLFCCFFLLSAGQVDAFFSDSVNIKNIIFSLAANDLPPPPELIAPTGQTSIGRRIIFEWQIKHLTGLSFDLAIYKVNPDLYPEAAMEFFYANLTGLSLPKSGYISDFPDGAYWWRMRSHAGNILGDWSQAEAFVVNTSSPVTKLKAQGRRLRTVNEEIEGGIFDNWINLEDKHSFGLSGNASLESITGNKFLRLGNAGEIESKGDFCASNLTYHLSNDARNLSFDYNFQTLDDFPFDDAGFVVYINNQPIYDADSFDVDSANRIKTSGWRQKIINIEDLNEIDLSFCVGNTIDNHRASWVLLDNIKTGEFVINSETKLELTAQDEDFNDEEIRKIYRVDDNSWQEYDEPFALDLDEGNHTLTYKSIDPLANEEGQKISFFIFDNTPPTVIDDLSEVNITSSSATLIFSSPADGEGAKVEEYELRQSLVGPSSEDEIESWWSAAQKVNISLLPDTPGFWQKITIPNLVKNQTYFFGLRSTDVAGNSSPVSNIVEVTIPAEVSPLLVTQILYDPVESPEDQYEWVEIYNRSSNTIDLTNWKIKDNNKENILVGLLPTKTYLLIVSNKQIFLSKYANFSGLVFETAEKKIGNGLANTEDKILFFNEKEEIQDEVFWGEDSEWDNKFKSAVSGKSIFRTNPSEDSDSSEDWEIKTPAAPRE